MIAVAAVVRVVAVVVGAVVAAATDSSREPPSVGLQSEVAVLITSVVCLLTRGTAGSTEVHRSLV